MRAPFRLAMHQQEARIPLGRKWPVLGRYTASARPSRRGRRPCHGPTATAAEFVEVDVHSLEFTPRSVGVEQVGLSFTE